MVEQWIMNSAEKVYAYAIGDIHGRADLLEKLLGKIKADARKNSQARPHIIFLGDYVDRGMESKKVVDLSLDFDLKGGTKVYLKGNHEAMMLDFLADPSTGPLWFENGGLATLLSYGVQPQGNFSSKNDLENIRDQFLTNIPKAHKDFYGNLVLNYELGNYFFVHAGVNPDRPLDKQTCEDLLWIRDKFLESKKPLEKTVVHGHSVVFDQMVSENHISVDTGAFFTGKLTCVVLESEDVRFIST